MLPVYKPSGRIGLATCFVLGPLVVVLLAVSWGYRFLLGQTASFVVISPLFLGFGAAVAGGCYVAGRIGKCRSPALGACMGVVAGTLVMAGMHFVQYQQQTAAGPRPSFARYLQDKARTGWRVSKFGMHKSGGITHRGPWVYVIWGFETVSVIAAGAWGGAAAARRPFCEPCNRWADHQTHELKALAGRLAVKAAITGAATVQQVLEPRLAAEGTTEDQLTYTVLDCPGCASLPTLTVRLTEVTHKGRKTESKTQTLHRYLLMSLDDQLAFEDLSARAAQIAGHT